MTDWDNANGPKINRRGKVYIIGAGSGATDLLTVRASRILAESDVVFCDALVNPEVTSLATRAKVISVGKRCGHASTAQRFINRSLVGAASRYEKVVRLKGGDPMIFGRAQEEIDALKAANIPFEVIPGITAALAASADLGVSLTKRGVSRSVVFVTPRMGDNEPINNWVPPESMKATLVIYMAAKQSVLIRKALLNAGYKSATPAVFVENASLLNRHVFPTTIARIDEAAMRLGHGPAILLIGEVCTSIAYQLDAALFDQGSLTSLAY